jgi:hypothetical protein
MAYSEHPPARLNPLTERTCSPQVHGLLSLTLGFVFQIGGKDSLESALTVNNDEDYSKLELDNLHATVQTYHTLMVCMFFISAGVQARPRPRPTLPPAPSLHQPYCNSHQIYERYPWF